MLKYVEEMSSREIIQRYEPKLEASGAAMSVQLDALNTAISAKLDAQASRIDILILLVEAIIAFMICVGVF